MLRTKSGWSRGLLTAVVLSALLGARTLLAAERIAQWSGVVQKVSGSEITLAGIPERFRAEGNVTELLTGRALSMSDVAAGASVTLRVGERGSDGVFPAREIRVQPRIPMDLDGELDDVAADGKSIRVHGVTIAIDDRTEFGGDAGVRGPGGLRPGRQVSVRLASAVSGLRAASVVDAGKNHSDLEDREAKGVLTAITATSLQLDGKTNFIVDANTRFVGNPVAGDAVEVKFHTDGAGNFVADRVEKETEVPDLEVEFSGDVEEISATSWRVAGRVLVVDSRTVIEGTPAVGDTVEVHAHQTPAGLVADRIHKEDKPEPAGEVEFSGKVEAVGATSWTVAGRILAITAATVFENSPKLGDTVEVKAAQTSTGLRALRIKAENNDPPPDKGARIEFQGVVTSIAATWSIGGRTVIVDGSTEIRGNPKVGDTVKVEALIKTDGSLLAREIEKSRSHGSSGGDDD